MGVLDATVKGASANSFVTVAAVDLVLRRRLYTTAWDAAGTTPNAEGFLTDNSYSAGSTTIGVDTGTGTFTSGSLVKFAGHDTEYTVSTALTGDGNLVLADGLTDAVGAGEAVLRLTSSEKEKAAMWSTQILSEMMQWYGYPTTTTQALPWPRVGVLKANSTGTYYDQDTIPDLLTAATSEMCLVVVEKDVFSRPAILGQGLSEAKIGPLNVKINPEQRIDVIPQNILSLLSPLGELEPEAKHGGSSMLPLWRT